MPGAPRAAYSSSRGGRTSSLGHESAERLVFATPRHDEVSDAIVADHVLLSSSLRALLRDLESLVELSQALLSEPETLASTSDLGRVLHWDAILALC